MSEHYYWLRARAIYM